jgi:hypothetical protein
VCLLCTLVVPAVSCKRSRQHCIQCQQSKQHDEGVLPLLGEEAEQSSNDSKGRLLGGPQLHVPVIAA